MALPALVGLLVFPALSPDPMNNQVGALSQELGDFHAFLSLPPVCGLLQPQAQLLPLAAPARTGPGSSINVG